MNTERTLITIRDVMQARKRITGYIRRTHSDVSFSLQKTLATKVYLKAEHLQITGSFKLRGATNAILTLSPQEKKCGVAGVSTGNYGRALAYAASQAGVDCIICMSELVPSNKVEGVKAAGAQVRIIGQSQDEAQQEVDRLVAQKQMIMLPPFDHCAVISGQGTLGLEVLEDVPDVKTILIPLSGGGLAAGVALVIKTLAPDCKVIGLSMERGAAMYESIKANKPIAVQEFPSLADSLGGGIGLDNHYTYAMVRDLVDEIILLSEEEIAAGISHAYWQEGEVLEGAGAIGIAALLAGKIENAGPIVCLTTGCNIDPDLHYQIISGKGISDE